MRSSLSVAIAISTVPSASALAVQNSFVGTSLVVPSASRRPTRNFPRSAGGGGGMTMYFDDVTRVPWDPSGKKGGGGIGNDDAAKRLAREKAWALKKFIRGHDAASASVLSYDEVKSETMEWALTSGLVGTQSDEYGSIAGTDVCRSSSLVGCLAGFWNLVVDAIEECADPRYPAAVWKTDGIESNELRLVVYPDADAYDYETMLTLKSSVEFCRDLCGHYGRKFTLRHFHPRYMNSPKMMSPDRHSPFPCLGLHFAGEEERANARDFGAGGGSGRGRGGESEGTNWLRSDDYVPSLRERRRSLEKIFNSAAASLTGDLLSYDKASLANGSPLSSDNVIDITRDWMEENKHDGRSMKDGEGQEKKRTNHALRFAHTIDSRWVVTNTETAEKAYAEIWSVISNLHDLCEAKEEETRRTQRASKSHDASVTETHEIMSAMFVATHFCACSASEFKRFAISVNAALKHLTGGKMFLEVFHPEFMGKNGYDNKLRRTPFPTIQVCSKILAK